MRKVRRQGDKLYVTSGTSSIVASWRPAPGNGHDELLVHVEDRGTPEDLEDAVKIVRQVMLGEDKD